MLHLETQINLVYYICVSLLVIAYVLPKFSKGTF